MLDRIARLDFNSMSEAGQIDYLLFRNHLQHEIRQLDLSAKYQADESA